MNQLKLIIYVTLKIIIMVMLKKIVEKLSWSWKGNWKLKVSLLNYTCLIKLTVKIVKR